MARVDEPCSKRLRRSHAIVVRVCRMRAVRRPAPRQELRVLVIRPWTESLAELRAALESAGHTVHIVRVDFEAAMDAALTRDRFDAAIFDPATPGISRDVVETSLRDHGNHCQIIELTDEIAAALRRAFVERWN